MKENSSDMCIELKKFDQKCYLVFYGNKYTAAFYETCEIRRHQNSVLSLIASFNDH